MGDPHKNGAPTLDLILVVPNGKCFTVRACLQIQNFEMEMEQNTAWTEEDCSFMRAALEEADKSRHRREVPVGCVLVRDGSIIARGHNMTNASRNGTRHAEFEAIDSVLQQCQGSVEAAQFQRCQLYVTVEPCIMCAGALSILGIGEVIFGCGNDKFGGCGSILDINVQGCGGCGASLGTSGCAQGHEGNIQQQQQQQQPSQHDHPQHDHQQQGSQQCAANAFPGYSCRRGLFADQAVQLLQDFYICGNPAAPKPHRPLRTPKWEGQPDSQRLPVQRT